MAKLGSNQYLVEKMRPAIFLSKELEHNIFIRLTALCAPAMPHISVKPTNNKKGRVEEHAAKDKNSHKYRHSK